MTRRDDTTENGASNEPRQDSPEWKRRKEHKEQQLATARVALAKLDNEGLAELLCEELDRRRLDGDGNTIPEREGLYEAATEAMLALLGLCKVEGMAARLAAVGCGARLLRKKQETVNAISWIEPLVEAIIATKSVAEKDRAQLLARDLEAHFGRPVSTDQIARAIAHPYPRRITEVVLAVGIIGLDDIDPDTDPELDTEYWREPHRRVTKALKRP